MMLQYAQKSTIGVYLSGSVFALLQLRRQLRFLQGASIVASVFTFSA